MSAGEQKMQRFTVEMVEQALHLWNHSMISIVDIRSRKLFPHLPLENYQLPSSMFLYATGGNATISLNQEPFKIDKYDGIFHAGKGAILSVHPLEISLEIYMVFYKAGPVPFYKRDMQHLLEKNNPFTQLYGFTSQNPIFFMEKFRQMDLNWKEPHILQRFQVKILLYQVVHQLYAELLTSGVHYSEPDYVQLVKQYLDNHYAESISIEELTGQLPISKSLLRRLFKQREDKGLQEYLNEKRLAAAKKYLLNSGMTVQEVAIGSGFLDELNLNRMFKKYEGMTPSEFRKKRRGNCTENDIDNDSHCLYNKEGLDNLAILKRDGELSMIGSIKTKEMIVATVMSLMLLLTACSSTAPANNGANSSGKPVQVEQNAGSLQTNTNTAETEKQTRTIKTVKGDVEVPLQPKRVVVQYLMGDLVALDVQPIAVTTVNKGAAYEDKLTDAAVLGEWDLNPEEMIKLDPDLIILASDVQYDDLSKIAPTIIVPYGSMSTMERLHFLGDIFDKTDLAEAALADYEAAIEKGKEQLAAAGLKDVTVSSMMVTDDGVWVTGNKHAVGFILHDELALQAPEAVQKEIIDAGEYWGSPSMELLQQYCGDYIVHMDAVPETVKQHPIWQAIPAVSNDHVISMDTALTYYTDVYSSIATINDIVAQLIKAKAN